MATLTIPQLYRSAIRVVSIVFGSVFNDIYIRKYNPDGSVNEDSKRKVPITFSNKSQYALWIENKMRRPDDGTKVGVTFPRLSYELTGLSPDDSRQLNSLLTRASIPTSAAETVTKKAWSPAAYTFNFTLSLWAADMDTSIQVLESILPYFKPEISVKIKEQADLPIMNDLYIILNSISKQDNYLEGFDTNRCIQWDMEFTVYANMWAPKPDEAKIITDVVIDLNDSNQISTDTF